MEKGHKKREKGVIVMGYLRICKCERKPLWYGADENEKKKIEKHFCEKCGKRFKVIPMPVIGVLVKLEGDPSDDCNWISLTEFKKLIKEAKP